MEWRNQDHLRLDWSSSTTNKMSLQTIIEIIANAGYEVRKIERWGLGPPRLGFSRFLMGK